MNSDHNARLEMLLDKLVQLSELWLKVPIGSGAHSVYTQIEFVRKLIRDEIKHIRSRED